VAWTEITRGQYQRDHLRYPTVTRRGRSLGCLGGSPATGSNLVNRSGRGNDPARQAPDESRSDRAGHDGVRRRAGVVAGIAMT
jgi:hypothetical protein